MVHDFDPTDVGQDVPPSSPDFSELPAIQEVPKHLDVLPDGREAVVIGDPEGCKEFNHMQGDNPYGYLGTCGLVSCEDVLRQFGVGVTEADIVEYASTHGLCNIDDDPAMSGGTSEFNQAQILRDHGIPAHMEVMDSLELLAQRVEEGRGIITEVNAEKLWGIPPTDPFSLLGWPNHAVVVTGVARDPNTGEIQGFFINDSGRGYPEDSGRFVDAATMGEVWLGAGGTSVVTDVVRVWSTSPA